jgi:murein DD-endopeptidase MepM/ murein hydrolase activator NlpD
MSDAAAARRRRVRLTRKAVAVTFGSLAVTATLTSTAPASHAVDGAPVSDEERRRHMEQSVEEATKIDPATVESEKLIVTLTLLDQYIGTRLARMQEVERSQVDAERRLAEHIRDLDTVQPEVQEITNALRVQAVRLYLDPEDGDASIRLLKAETFDDAQQRRVLGDLVTGNSRELIDRLHVVKPRRDALQKQAMEARDEAAARKKDREETYQRVIALQETQRKLQTEWDRRTSRSGGYDGSDLDGDALSRAIADQKNKLPPAPPPAPAPVSNRMIWPASGPITDRYGYLSSRGRNHWGIDVGAPTGAPVKAALGGTVVMAGYNGGYGNVIAIDHPNGLQTRYAHLSRFNVRNGAVVSQGQLIGAVGSTGASTGPHLHFEVYRNGAHVNPMNYLP